MAALNKTASAALTGLDQPNARSRATAGEMPGFLEWTRCDSMAKIRSPGALSIKSAFRPKAADQTGSTTLRSTPPDAFAHDYDRQQVSWLASRRLWPPSQDLSIPVVIMVVGSSLTVAGAAAALPVETDAPHSLG